MGTAKALGMYIYGLSVATGFTTTAFCKSKATHAMRRDLFGPWRRQGCARAGAEAGRGLGRKGAVGVSVGGGHTAVWSDAGELFTFGNGDSGRLGHGGGEANEFVPRLVEAFAGKKVIGASGGGRHTAVWTETGELYTFGYGRHGKLGHRDKE